LSIYQRINAECCETKRKGTAVVNALNERALNAHYADRRTEI